ncbi:MAG: radical SAM protein, partial [archaeon]
DILLVNPPSGFLIDQRVFLPLGIASVAATARESGHQVSLLDLAGEDNYERRIVEEISNHNYDAVGITATSPQFYYAHKLLGAIKGRNPSLKVIIGGSHPSMFSALRDNLRESSPNFQERLDEDPNFKRLEDFDVIAAGEESSLEAALSVDGRGVWVDGGVTKNLESLPFPARDLFDVNSYLFDPQGTPKFKIKGKPSGSIISQRGCPYTCEFCCGRDSKMYHAVTLPGGVLRAHTPERIVAELDEMNKKFGLESFMFYDDEFNLHPERTKKLCEALKGRNYTFRGFVKSDLLVKHPEVATAMKEAGFVEVLTGVESGSERILSRHLHKKTSPELNYRAAMICLENGLGFKALTMLGHVSETPRDVMDTRDWILRTGKAFGDKLGPEHFTFDLTVFQPYAGCPIWDRSEKNQELFGEEFKWVYHSRHRGDITDPEYGGLYFNKVDFSTEQGFYKGIPGEYKAFIRTKNISSEQLVSLRDAIEWDVRDRLKMPQLAAITAEGQFEHSMGQGKLGRK